MSSRGMRLSTEAQPGSIIIFPGMIFSTITLSGNVKFILLYRTEHYILYFLPFVFSYTFQGEGSSKRNAWMKDMFFTKMVLFLTVWMLELITDVRFNKLRHKNWWRQTSHQAASCHVNGDTLPYAILMQTRKFRQIRSNLVSTCSALPN